MNALSKNVRSALFYIARQESAGKIATTIDLANYLGFSRAGAARIIGVLAKYGYISKERYKHRGIKLTEQGILYTGIKVCPECGRP